MFAKPKRSSLFLSLQLTRCARSNKRRWREPASRAANGDPPDSKRVSTSARSSERTSRAPVLSQSSIRNREHQRPEQQAEVESTSARNSNGYREHKRGSRAPALRQQARECKGKQNKNARETNDLKHQLMDAQLEQAMTISMTRTDKLLTFILLALDFCSYFLSFLKSPADKMRSKQQAGARAASWV